MTRGYAPIGDYGVIGDLHTVALVGMDGSIDFLCLPSFDSPSVFAALLDAERGGRFQIAPVLDGAARKQLYLPDTNVLLTRFLDDRRRRRGVGLHAGGGRRAARTTSCGGRRRCAARSASGCAATPRFDYGARHAHGRAARATPRCCSSAARAAASWRCGCASSVPMRVEDGAAVAEFTLARRRVGVVRPRGGDARRAVALRRSRTTSATRSRQTVNFWRRWIDRSTYQGRWREMVNRSALDAEAPHLAASTARSSRRRRSACPRASAACATGTTATPGSATRPSRSTA